MKTATDATQHLQNAMLCHTQLASQRNETLLLDILTPAQTALFLEWMKKNKERCRGLMERQLRVSAADGSPAVAGAANNNAESESTLGGVCKQLEEMRFQEEWVGLQEYKFYMGEGHTTCIIFVFSYIQVSFSIVISRDRVAVILF